MNALSEPVARPRSKSASVRPLRTGQPHPQKRKARSQRRATRPFRKTHVHGGQGVEAAVGLGVNALCIGVGLCTLFHLVPYQLAQQAKLSALRSEVMTTEERVQQLEQAYQNSQNPEEQERIAEEQSHLIGAKKRKVVWMQQ